MPPGLTSLYNLGVCSGDGTMRSSTQLSVVVELLGNLFKVCKTSGEVKRIGLQYQLVLEVELVRGCILLRVLVSTSLCSNHIDTILTGLLSWTHTVASSCNSRAHVDEGSIAEATSEHE
eukprot:2922465-Amphidinium_carterae.1